MRRSDLGATLGYDPSAISRLETRRRRATNVELLRRVAIALEINLRGHRPYSGLDVAEVLPAEAHPCRQPVRLRPAASRACLIVCPRSDTVKIHLRFGTGWRHPPATDAVITATRWVATETCFATRRLLSLDPGSLQLFDGGRT